ncbi:MAG: transposase [Firmicutes bacterium]|nr:transposase [Bacillota bacterium]
MDNLPQRKKIRLKGFDYSQAGYYFVTICTHNRRKLLSNIVGGGFHAAPQAKLTLIGKEIVKTLEHINDYPNVKIDQYVIMPNHIHFIVILQSFRPGGRGNPPLHKVVGQLKSYTNKMYNEINRSKNLLLWQRNYYDRIIRDERELQDIREYIETNPLKWHEDKYFV